MKDIHILNLNRYLKDKGPFIVTVIRNDDKTITKNYNITAIGYNETILVLFSKNKWVRCYNINNLSYWDIDLDEDEKEEL